MERTEKDFRQYVSSIRKSMPEYNNGRKVVVLSEYTKKGLSVIRSASVYDGTRLYQVYHKWSDAKQVAYDEAYEMYRNDKNASGFSICSHNSYRFTVSWVTDGKVIFMTPTTEYIVVCNE